VTSQPPPITLLTDLTDADRAESGLHPNAD
jgi:hypothetical protein